MKNITTFKTELPTIDVIENLIKDASDLTHTDCPENQMRSFGFAPSSAIVKLDNGYRIDFVFEQKKIPANIINRAAKKIVDQLEAQELRSATRVEKGQIREEVLIDLCKQAFTEITNFSAFYHSKKEFLIINTGNKDQAGALMGCLAKLSGSIKTTTLHVCGISNGLDTAALECIADGHLRVAGFDFGEKLNLQHIEDKSQTAKFSTDYKLDHIQDLLTTGYTIKSLSLKRGDLSFILTDDFKIKSIGKSDELFESLEDDFEDVQEAQIHEQGVMLELMTANVEALITHFDKVANTEELPKAA
ncbi:MAG: recombination-associated protein RdgC [Bermanella sp.]